MFSDAGKHLIIIKSPPSNPAQRKAICSIAFFFISFEQQDETIKKEES